jgi:Tol biopolymer transport system component
MRARRLATAITMLLAGVWVMSPGVARATPATGNQGDDGNATRIVWSRFVALDFSAARIVIADAQGRGVRELTHSSNGVVDIDPQLSPDGRLVTFERDLPDGRAQVVLVGSDGRGERVLDLGCVDPCAADVSPTWAPDGRHILFTPVVGPFDQINGSARSAVLWRADLRGGHRERVSPPGIDGAFEDYHATFAPGGYLVFVRVRNADIMSAAFRMDRAGTHVRRLTPWAVDADLPFVSPARTGPTRDLVVFETFGHGPPDGTSSAIATVPATCRSESECAEQIRYLTSQHALPVQNFNPGWSPDGRRIVFVRFSSSASAPPRGDIWSMRWNGEERKPVSRSPLFEFRPSWGRAPSE